MLRAVRNLERMKKEVENTPGLVVAHDLEV